MNTAKRISHSRLISPVALAPEAPKPARVPRAPQPLGVVDQVRLAFKPKTRLATLLGCMLGGLVPMTSFVVARQEISSDVPLYMQVSTLLVLGGLLFSASTVYTWGKLAFRSPAKALGFVVLTEGALVLAKTGWLGVVALGYLVAINGIATGCTLALNKEG